MMYLRTTAGIACLLTSCAGTVTHRVGVESQVTGAQVCFSEQGRGASRVHCQSVPAEYEVASQHGVRGRQIFGGVVVGLGATAAVLGALGIDLSRDLEFHDRIVLHPSIAILSSGLVLTVLGGFLMVDDREPPPTYLDVELSSPDEQRALQRLRVRSLPEHLTLDLDVRLRSTAEMHPMSSATPTSTTTKSSLGVIRRVPIRPSDSPHPQ